MIRFQRNAHVASHMPFGCATICDAFCFSLCLFALACGPNAAIGAEATNSTPLHVRIDRTLAQSFNESSQTNNIGVVDDATFLRRVWLDLAGSIPSAKQLRAFLAEKDANKRAKKVDELLASDRFAQHMANVFDVMLMERRADKHVKRNAWRAYLVDGFAKNKPYNVIVSEVLSADGADIASRSQAAFYLNREGEHHQLTRDVGRIFFGRDLQCAQCHDHPDIDDMRQSEYFNLFAFVHRTALFTDKKKVVSLSEKAEGEVKFTSVFTKASFEAKPAIPGGKAITEPSLEAAKLYKVKPAKGVRSVPTFSRRQQLAIELAKGTNLAFRKNIVNRLWAHMMGRGLVHPVDMMHAANPASHPKVLTLMSKEFAANEFNIKKLLREMALTKAYQRPFELSAPAAPADATLLREQLKDVKVKLGTLKKQVFASFDRLDDADAKLVDAAKAAAAPRDAMGQRQKSLAAAQNAAVPIEKTHQTTVKQIEEKARLKASVDAAIGEIQLAAAKADDPTVMAAKALFDSKAAEISTELKTLQAVRSKQAAAVLAINAKVASEKSKFDAAQKSFNATNNMLRHSQSEMDSTLASHQAHTTALAIAEREVDRIEALLAMARDTNDASPLLADAAADALSDHTIIRNLKPLTPEQLAWSMMQATGVVDAYRRSLPIELKKQAESSAAKATAAARKKDKDAPAVVPIPVTPAQIDQALNAKLAGSVKVFADLFSAAAGQPQDTFFATVDQALFFSNSSTLKSWLAPSGGYLIDRLNKEKDVAKMTNELYQSVLTREPTQEEIKDVADYMASRGKDRVVALQEIAWALLTSVEFRFCR